MHISEGVLTPQMLAAGWAIAGVGVGIGLKKVNTDKIVRVALFSSVFFLASLVNVRLGPVSTHLSLLAPIGLVLGWSAFPAVFTALLLQAVLFHFGGLWVLGANTTDMALPALVVYLLFSETVQKRGSKISLVAAFIAGFLAVIMGALGIGVFMGLSDQNLMGVVRVVFLAHIPLAFAEGAITAFMVVFLQKAAPELLTGVK